MNSSKRILVIGSLVVATIVEHCIETTWMVKRNALSHALFYDLQAYGW